MAKIDVPQGLQEKIIDLYVNKDYTRKKIKSDLDLPFGDSVIKRVLEENNILIKTNPGAKKGGRKKQEVSQELQEKIIKLYDEKGYSLDRIVKELSLPFGFDKVRSILQDNNIHIRNVQEAHKTTLQPELRKYLVNDDYLLESHNGAWLLGFIAADGYLPITKGAKNKIVITLQLNDKCLLEMIAQEIGFNGPIHEYEFNGVLEASLSFTSKKLRQQIEQYGIVNNKSFKLTQMPDLPEKYKIDFIRGYFDGDGSLYRNKSKDVMNSSFCGVSLGILQDIRDYLHEHYGLTKVNIHEVQRVSLIYDFRYGVADTLKMCSAFYDNSYMALPRKKELFYKLREEYNAKRK